MYPYNIESEAVNAQEETFEAQNAYTRPHDDEYDIKIVEMIFYSHKHETSNIKYYTELAALTKSHNDKKIITDIILDCTKHCKIFNDICNKLPSANYNDTLKVKLISDDYVSELEACIFMLMEDVDFYRHLMFSESRIKDKMHEIIIDKQNHIMKLIFLRSKT